MKKRTICTIYAREAIRRKKGEYFHERTFGWFATEKQAKDYLKKNPKWIHECLYDYVVIEKFPQGIYCLAEKEWWYKWNEDKYEPIEKPKEFFNVINFALG